MADVNLPEPQAQGHAGRWGAYTYFAFAGVAAATLVAGYMLARLNKEFEIRFGADGEFAIAVQAGDDLSQILDQVFAAKPRYVEALMTLHDYYPLRSANLAVALARIDVTSETDKDVTKGLRELMWMQRGPFQAPGALSGADDRLFAALEQLEEESRLEAKSNRLLALLWQSSIEQKGFFRPRVFRAEVVPVLHGRGVPGGAKEVYACPGNVLVGKSVTIVGSGEGEFVQISGKLSDDPIRFACNDDGASLYELLGGGEFKMGVDPITFAELADPNGNLGTLPEIVEAKFQVQSIDITEPVRPSAN